MPTTMTIDGFEIPIEYDPDEDRFYGVAQVEDGWISFYGRDPDELRADFRELYRVHKETRAEMRA